MSYWKYLVLAPLVILACDVATPVGPPKDTVNRPDISRPDTGPTRPDHTTCDPTDETQACPEGMFCETHARVCVECVADSSRCVGEAPYSQRESCQKPQLMSDQSLEGGFYEADACPSGETCVPLGVGRTRCEPVVCEPGFGQCQGPTRALRCNDDGTAEIEERCDAGEACYIDRCEQVKHNVLVIFDTSGSMMSYINPEWNRSSDGRAHSPLVCRDNPHPCIEPWPVCEQADDPLTIFALSKNVFTEVVQDAIGGFAQFALQRFPQQEALGQGGNCSSGWYRAQDDITGDDDSRDTETGTWFETHLSEAVIVPFPVRRTIDNVPQILRWIDHEETMGARPEACETSEDCGPGGYCGRANNEKRCFHHTNPELRAISRTPLGKSLFYAGEYFRRFVRVDGKPCTTDASCDSAGYRCGDDGTCYDPYRHCKDDYIILFTDGGESFYQNHSEFFNPVVQAKRLAYGLDCSSDDDCRGGASCTDGVCLAPGMAPFSPELAKGEGYGALSTPGGDPISIKTTVITLDSIAALNAQIARAGGGASLDVSSDDPDTFRRVLREAMMPNFKCRPEDL